MSLPEGLWDTDSRRAPAFFQRRPHAPVVEGPPGQLGLQLLLGHLQGQRLSVQPGLGSRQPRGALGFALRLSGFLSFDVLFAELCYQGAIAIISKREKDLKVLLLQEKQDKPRVCLIRPL